MGIYEKVLPTLDPLPVADLGRQEKIDKIKASLNEEAQSSVSLAYLYRTLRQGLHPRPTLDEIVGTLQPLETEDERRLALIELFGKDGLKALLYDCEMRIAALEQLLAESEEQEQPGWGAYGAKPNALRLEDGTTIRVQEEPACKVENPDAFRMWCIANGYENSLRLWPSTTEAITRERLKRGEKEPDGVHAYRWKKVVLTPPRGVNGGSDE